MRKKRKRIREKDSGGLEKRESRRERKKRV